MANDGFFSNGIRGVWDRAINGIPKKAKRHPIPTLNKRARATSQGDSTFQGQVIPTANHEYDISRAVIPDPDALAAMPIDELQELIARISPEISKALWDFTVFLGSAYDVQVFDLDRTTPNDAGQELVEEFIRSLDQNEDQGTTNIVTVLHRIITGGFIRGAFAAEMVVNNAGTEIISIATPDPASFRFRKMVHSELGEIWEMGQDQTMSANAMNLNNTAVSGDMGEGTQFRSFFGVPTVKYVPIIPLTTSPYGVSWLEPAIYPGLFMIMVLQDFRRVVANQGYPRLDIAVDLEKMASTMPRDTRNDPALFREWVNDAVSQIATVYASLEPSDAYIHTDDIKVNAPVGTMASNQTTAAIDQLMQTLERLMVRSLKTIPFLLSARVSTTERQAVYEWASFSTSVRIIQGKLAFLMNRLFKQLLTIHGMQGVVEFTFYEIDSTDQLQEGQAEAVKIQNAITKRNQGWISNTEASVEITGSEPFEDNFDIDNLGLNLGVNPTSNESDPSEEDIDPLEEVRKIQRQFYAALDVDNEGIIKDYNGLTQGVSSQNGRSQ